MHAQLHWQNEVCSWWHVRGPSAVLIIPPLGYEYFASHASLKALADHLAHRGYTVVRVDLHGNGDSGGHSRDPDRLAAWRLSVHTALAALASAGATKVHVVGLRFGATLALELAQVDDIVAWAPVISGKRWMRELRMLSVPMQPAGFVSAGAVFTEDAIAAVSSLSVGAVASRRVLLLSRSSQPLDATLTQLREQGVDATLEPASGSEQMLDVPAEEAVTPYPLIARIGDWLTPPEPGRLAFVPTSRAHLAWRDGAVEETSVEIAGHVGIEGSGAPDSPIVVFVNSGSEPHVGPGRAWVEYARDLNRAGFATLRVDWPGWGENFIDKPGRPYDAHCVEATTALVDALRARGQRVVLAGLCAGAWVSVQAALATRVDGVIAINPQLYWNRGDPVEARLDDTRRRRTDERRREERLGRLGIWSILDALGGRPPAARWLAGLGERSTRTLLLFSAGDDGVAYLRTRLQRSLSRELTRGWLSLVEIAELDHQMYREWRRNDVVAAMVDFLSDQKIRDRLTESPPLVTSSA